jgi:tRNA (guanine37-N1)-methyltransferase
MTFHIITLFPKAFNSYLGESILKRAIEDKKISVKFYNPRDFTENKWKRIDRAPYGGGPGMVIQAEPVIKAIQNAKGKIQKYNSKVKIIWLTPSGKQFTNAKGKQYAKKHSDIIIVCGRYEGIDARVKKIFKTEEISVGPFILTGGELAAEIVIDVVARQIKGVLGNEKSREEERVASSDVYTRPEVFSHNGKKYRVPKILLTGHHAKIDAFRAVS